MHQNDIFLFFKKLFLRSAHQNDPKHKKNYFLTKTKLNFLEVGPRLQTLSKPKALH
jgi:hypothetical protein